MLIWFLMATLIADAVRVLDMRLCQIATSNGTPEEMRSSYHKVASASGPAAGYASIA
jgi:hypothetical protein